MEDKNKIYLEKRLKLILNNEIHTEPQLDVNENEIMEKEEIINSYVATILRNIESYGYTLSEEIINVLKTKETDFLVEWYTEVIEEIKKIVGCREEFSVMYPNFPKQIMEMDDVEIYINAIIHYWSGGIILPKYEHDERFPLMIKKPDLKVIRLGSEEDFNTIFTNLLSSKSSISKGDKKIIQWFIVTYQEEIRHLIPKNIYNKEILGYFTNVMIQNCNNAIDGLKIFYKTATDVLRLAVSLSGGDVSLKENTRFKNFTSKERKLLLGLLEQSNGILEDMYRYEGKWKVLGKALHVSSYNRYPKVKAAFFKLRTNANIITFRSKLVELYSKGDIEELLQLLSSRPGEMARNMDRLLRTYTSEHQQEKIIATFDKISSKVATPILFQMHKYFKERITNKTERVFYPKGEICNAYSIENTLPPIKESVCKVMENVCKKALIGELSKKNALGNVFVDEELKRYTIPNTLRNSQRAIRTVGRGTRLPIKEDTNILRTFVYWKEPQSYENNIDLDLGAVFYSKDYKLVRQLNWQTSGLKIKHLNCVHSGDITSAPNGATECIDIDLKKLKEHGIGYVGLVVNSYSEVPFTTMDDCFIGYMERNNGDEGEIFEPLTVRHKIDMAINCQMVMAMVVDIEKNEVIWSELAIKENDCSFNSITENMYQIGIGIKSIINTEKPTIYDLAILNARARANEIVDNKDDADTIFSVDEGITPFDTDIILAELL